jgi:hypothetical protein
MNRGALLTLFTRSQIEQPASRRHPCRRHLALEALESRVLLAATIYTVSNPSGFSADISGTLPNAVSQADSNTNPDGSIIQFSQSVFSKPQTILLRSTLMLTNTSGPIVVDGPGANLVTVSGNESVAGVFQVAGGVTATLSGLTITGAAIIEPANGGGIVNAGNLTVTACNITSNSGADGGGIENSGVLSLTGSTIADNSGGSGGGIFNSAQGNANVTDCTIDSNRVPQAGGGADNSGSLVLFDCTIADNTGAPGGGVANSGDLVLFSCTVVSNVEGFPVPTPAGTDGTPGDGGGLFASPTTPRRGGIELSDTIVALNTDDLGPNDEPADDISGAVIIAGAKASTYNLIGTGGSGGLVNGTSGNLVGIANPGLAPLGNYGGPNQTIALDVGSPALGAGSVAVDGGQTTDGRGPGYARTNNGNIDIGAYELQIIAFPKVVKAVSVGWGTAGVAQVKTAADGTSLLPVGRKNDLPWYGIDMVEVSFTQPVVLTAADVTLLSARGIDYGPVTINGMGTSYTVMLARPIDKADRVMVSISIPETDTFMGRLNVLPGDFYDTGVVTSKDLTAIRNESTGKHGAMPTIFGDILGNGTVNSADYRAAKHFLGTKLPKWPKSGRKEPRVVLARLLPLIPRMDVNSGARDITA